MSDEIEKRRQLAHQLGTYDDVPFASELRRARRENATPRRMVIPGLLPEGYHPTFGSPPKVGKTTMAIDLTSAIMNGTYDGRRFLDHFEPSEIPQEELWEHPVWYFNAETPSYELEQAMKEAQLEEWIDHGLIVENLEDRDGDPTILDVRNEDNYFMWEWMLTHDDGEGSLGSRVSRPSFVLVDGLTAILGGDVYGYAQWMAAWRRLMRSLQIPSGLIIAHSTWKGDHLTGNMEASAGGDGNWTYERSRGSGMFRVKGRTGAPSIDGLKVRLDPDGRLRAGGNRPAAVASSSSSAGPAGRDLNAEVRAAVIEMHSKGMQPSGNSIRDAIPGRNPDIDAAVSALVNSGQLERYDRTLRGGGNAYRPVHVAP